MANDPKYKAEKVDSIDEAIRELDEMAHESSEELKGKLSSQYHNIKKAVADMRPEIKKRYDSAREVSKEAIISAKDNVVDFSTEKAQKVQESVHKSPWKFIGSAALGAISIGFLLGRRSKKM